MTFPKRTGHVVSYLNPIRVRKNIYIQELSRKSTFGESIPRDGFCNPNIATASKIWIQVQLLKRIHHLYPTILLTNQT
jgi:hypothetical protein